jgi:hypothetical protein
MALSPIQMGQTKLTKQALDVAYKLAKEEACGIIKAWADGEAKKNKSMAEHYKRSGEVLVDVFGFISDAIYELLKNGDKADVKKLIKPAIQKYAAIAGMATGNDAIEEIGDCIGGVIGLILFVRDKYPDVQKAVQLARGGVMISTASGGALVVIGGTLTVAASAYILFVGFCGVYDGIKTAKSCRTAMNTWSKPSNASAKNTFADRDFAIAQRAVQRESRPSNQIFPSNDKLPNSFAQIFESRDGLMLFVNHQPPVFKVNNPFAMAPMCRAPALGGE